MILVKASWMGSSGLLKILLPIANLVRSTCTAAAPSHRNGHPGRNVANEDQSDAHLHHVNPLHLIIASPFELIQLAKYGKVSEMKLTLLNPMSSKPTILQPTFNEGKPNWATGRSSVMPHSCSHRSYIGNGMVDLDATNR